MGIVPEWSPATLKQAAAGSDEDLIRGSIGRAVILLAVPMVLELLMESVFAVCDVFYVSRLGIGPVTLRESEQSRSASVLSTQEGRGFSGKATEQSVVIRRVSSKKTRDPRSLRERDPTSLRSGPCTMPRLAKATTQAIIRLLRIALPGPALPEGE